MYFDSFDGQEAFARFCAIPLRQAALIILRGARRDGRELGYDEAYAFAARLRLSRRRLRRGIRNLSEIMDRARANLAAFGTALRAVAAEDLKAGNAVYLDADGRVRRLR